MKGLAPNIDYSI